MHKRESPSVIENESRSHTISDILSRTPNRFSPIIDTFTNSPNLKEIEKRIRDLEDIRQIENEKHRNEIERLESMIDKMQQNRKNDPKIDILQQAYDQKAKELSLKNQEIIELRGKIKNENFEKKKPYSGRCNSRDSLESRNKNKLLSNKTTKTITPVNNNSKELEKELDY